MTTLVAKLDPALAKRVARVAEAIGLTHEQLALEAVRLFVRAAAPAPARPSATPRPRKR